MSASVRGVPLRNAELSSLLDLRLVCLKSVKGHRGVVVAKRRNVVTFGLAFSFCVSKVSTVTGIGRVVVAKHRTVATFGLALGRRVSRVVTFGLAVGEKREERDSRRGEKREERE